MVPGGGYMVPGGGLPPGGCMVETPPTPTAAGGTHPTGMHSCGVFVQSCIGTWTGSRTDFFKHLYYPQERHGSHLY